MSKFINPFTDVGFKRIFGQEFSKPVLLTFLNSLLEGERRIVNIEYLDKEKIGLSDGNRSLIYDILCKTDNGEYIIVEMQNKSQPFFKNRCIYYASRSIVEQGERGANGSTRSVPSTSLHSSTSVWKVSAMSSAPTWP